MIGAGEAYTIAIKVNEVEDQLQTIEEYIVKQASKGKFELHLHPSVPYHPRTIEILKEHGYIVKEVCDNNMRTFHYEIYWNGGVF